MNSKFNKSYFLILLSLIILMFMPSVAFAMHISEGILTLPWAGFWFIIAVPFVVLGVKKIRESTKKIPAYVPFVGMVAAALFIVSAMPIPVPFVGTTSHPSGAGLAAILIGPFATIVATAIALLIQALFLAHGGISTWGANIVSMGIIGSFTGYSVFKLLKRFNLPIVISAFLAGLLSDWATYAMTSLQLAFGLAGKEPIVALFKTILIAFIPTQFPIGILEGFAAAGFISFAMQRRPDILISLGVLSEAYIKKLASKSKSLVNQALNN